MKLASDLNPTLQPLVAGLLACSSSLVLRATKMETWKEDGLACLITAMIAVCLVESIKGLATLRYLHSTVARKIMHISTGPVFVACWPLFSDEPTARYFAAVIPLAVTLQFALVGLGAIEDDAVVRSMSRTGNRQELLKGPLMYGLVALVVTILQWRTLTGVTALMLLCAGDGFADLVGRQLGKHNSVSWNSNKSIAGCAAFFLSAIFFSACFHQMFMWQGWTVLSLPEFMPKLVFMSFVATLVESLPVKDCDNLTVYIAAIISEYLYDCVLS